MKAQLESRVIVYHFFVFGARCGWVLNDTLWPLYPRERPGTHCIGGQVGPRAVMDRREKSCPHRESILWPSSYPGPPRFADATHFSQLSPPPPLDKNVMIWRLYNYCVQPNLLHETEKRCLREILTDVPGYMLRVKVVLVEIYRKFGNKGFISLPFLCFLFFRIYPIRHTNTLYIRPKFMFHFE